MNTVKLYLTETTDASHDNALLARKFSNEITHLLVVLDCAGSCVCLTPVFSQFAAFMASYANESF